VPHPNQLALPVAVDRWIKQSHKLEPATAHDRLNGKIALITEAINVIASDADDIPVEFAGLGIVDLMAAQATLTIEAQVALRISRLGVATGAAA
jgi:hypothetical protein